MQKLNCILLITTLLISCNVFNNETIKKIPTDVLFELKKRVLRHLPYLQH